jgi:hypothetical protein
MTNDITISPSIDAFFDESVVELQDDYYIIHSKECDICGADEKADASEIVEQASNISPTKVVQTKTCPSPHVFHKLCLHTWLRTKIHKDEDATCPMCRTRFILSARSKKMQVYLEQLQSHVRRCNTVIEHTALQMNQIGEEIERAKQEQHGIAADETRKLALLDKRRALVTAQRVAVNTNALAREDLAKCLDAIRRVEAVIVRMD